MNLPLISNSPNPHTPQRLTWQVFSQTGEVVWSTSKEAPLWTWWPSLTPDICALIAGLDTWDIPGLTSEETRRRPRHRQDLPPSGFEGISVWGDSPRSHSGTGCENLFNVQMLLLFMFAPGMGDHEARKKDAGGWIIIIAQHGDVRLLEIPIGALLPPGT